MPCLMDWVLSRQHPNAERLQMGDTVEAVPPDTGLPGSPSSLVTPLRGVTHPGPLRGTNLLISFAPLDLCIDL